jgi:ligand-binding sensor domain-containing protein
VQVRKSTATPVPAPRDAAQLVPRGRSGRFIPQRINYLWLGTAEGLVRFDGNQFTVYDRTSTPALPSGNIKSLAVAADGALWIGFRRHGLARLHANQLTRWTTTEGLSGNEIVSLVTTPDGSIWAGAATQGLNRIRQGRVTIYRRQQDLPDNDCYALAVAPRAAFSSGLRQESRTSRTQVSSRSL